MAHGTSGFETWERPSHDGALQCALCVSSDPGTGHDWCAIAEALVCDDCCDALLQGDLVRLFSMAVRAGRLVTPESLIESCSECPRARQHAEEHLLHGTASDAPAC